MIVPGRSTLFVAGMLVLSLLAVALMPALLMVALGTDVALLLVCVGEGLWLRRTPVHVERERWGRLQIGRQADLVYRIENVGRRPVTVRVRQVWPESFTFDDDTVEVQVAPGEVARAALRVTPHRRGRVVVAAAQVDVRFTTDLARRRTLIDDQSALRVFPNLHAVAEYDTLRRHRALGQFGVHRRRMVGSGREFDRLRDYQPDDQYSDINWKATARRMAPVTNVHQAERNQDLLLCLDAGRMMGNPVGDSTALDHAVDAAVLLAYVSQRSGDRVGMILFRDVVDTFIKPGGEASHIHRIIDALVDADARGVFPSFSELAAHIRRNQTRRAMIFLFTDLNDPQLATNMTQVLGSVSRRHIVVVISLRDPLLEEIAGGAARNPGELHRVLAARTLADERAARVRELMKAGVQVLEVDADSITVDVINAYLSVKVRQLV